MCSCLRHACIVLLRLNSPLPWRGHGEESCGPCDDRCYRRLRGNAVLAADMAIKAPPPAPVVTPPLDWTGFYVGGNFGSGWATTSDSNTFFGATTGNYHTAGAIGGGQLGYNWQTSQWVLGVESDYDFSNVKGSTSAGLCAGVVCTIENTWVGTTRGRIGYSVGNWLPYATGRRRLRQCAHPGFRRRRSVHGGTNRTGWTAGAGIEYALTRNWSLKVEISLHRPRQRRRALHRRCRSLRHEHANIQRERGQKRYRISLLSVSTLVSGFPARPIGARRNCAAPPQRRTAARRQEPHRRVPWRSPSPNAARSTAQ